MRRPILVLLMLIAFVPASPLAAAHFPPGPWTQCQRLWNGDGQYHDYLPPSDGSITVGRDGNLAVCPTMYILRVQGVFTGDQPPCVTLPLPPPLCDELTAQIEMDFDGELDHAFGGAFLYADSGDGLTYGSIVCYGPPSLGHHSRSISALDTLGFGPQFLVTSDHSAPGATGTPDCGDGVIEPCPGTPRLAGASMPFASWTRVNGGIGGVCNPLDQWTRFDSITGGPSGGFVPFGPGSDGAYIVFIEQDTNTPAHPTAGHVWTN